MKKLMKWLIRITMSLVVLIVIAAVVLTLVIDPNDYKDNIESKIQENIGRTAHLDGDIQWKVFPWLALSFNDVKIDNQEGFKGDSLAEVQTLSARVKLLPLLSKNIELGQMTIEGAKFNLQVNKKGRSNWQSIQDHLNGDDSKNSSSDEDKKTSTVNIAGIVLNNISVHYTDLQSKTHAKISELNLSVGALSANEPVNIKASLHVNVAETGLDVDVQTDVTAKNLLNDAGIIATVNEFSVNGKLSGQSVLPIDIKLNQQGQLDLVQDTLTIPAVEVVLGDAKISTNLTGKNISQNNRLLSGTFKLDEMNLNDFLKKLTGAYFVTTDTFDDFRSSGNWSMLGKGLNISDLEISYADTAIEGQAQIKNLDKLNGKFSLHINRFNVDDFLGNETTSQSVENDATSAEIPDINFGHLSGSISIDELLASGTKVENLKISVNTNGSKMSLSPIQADFYQGLLVSAIKIDTKALNNKVIVEHNMDKIQAGPLLTDLAGSELLTGIGNFEVNLNIDKPFSDIPLKTAHGNISYSLSDGAIYGVDVFGMMQKGLSVLYPEVKKDTDEDAEKKTTFALMQLDADINEGILSSKKLLIESPYLKIKGKVTIDLVKMTIKGTIEPELLDIPEQLVSDKYKKLIGLPIPVRLSGSLLEPKVSIDAKILILNTQKKKIKKEKDKLKKKLLDGLFGGG